MKQDKKGFVYPHVNTKLCDDCSLCVKTCPIQNEREARIPNHTYALKHKSESIRQNSSSGGAFSVFAKETLTNGGVVFGATFDQNWNVVHSIIDSLDQLPKVMKSKYVQSNLNDIFRQVKEKLNTGIPVLFSGTPCQVAGLINFLGKRFPNLTTIDFICHGVPSPKIWQDYLKEAVGGKKTKNSATISDINFRDKSEGWIKFHFIINTVSNTRADGNNTLVNEYIWDNDYMLAFLNDYINRPSCHECHFRNGKSGADYTIADYWGIDKLYPDFFDDKGVSLLLSYSTELPEYIKASTEFIETTFDDACFGNLCIKSSWPYKPLSHCFFFLHNYLGFSIHSSLRKTMLIEKYSRNVKANAKRIRKRIKAV